MAEVEVEIGGRRYRVGCDAGQEGHLREVAALVSEEAHSLRSQLGELPEVRLLLMSGLLLADKLQARNTDLRQAEMALRDMASRREDAPAPVEEAQPGLFAEDGAEIARLRGQVASLEAAMEDSHGAREEILARASAASEEVDELRGELAGALDKAEALETELAEMKEGVDIARLEAEAARIDALEDELRQKDLQLAEARAHAAKMVESAQSAALAEAAATASVQKAAERVRDILAELNVTPPAPTDGPSPSEV